MTITQLDLFSGIGGFHLGFERAGYKVKSYFSEVDKHAIAVYKHRFKDAEYVGSVTDVRGADLPRIDLITFGSPCQDFSLAGKRKGMGGERSSLILEAIRLITECKPRVFIWENVKGAFSSNDGADFAAILQAFVDIGGYRLEWQLLNTSWFLPQNRERIYLVGHLAEARGDWGGVFPITTGTGEDIGVQGHHPRANTITARYFASTANGSYVSECEQPKQEIKVKSATSTGYDLATEGDSINLTAINSTTRRGRVGKQIAQTLDTLCEQAVVDPAASKQGLIQVGAIRSKDRSIKSIKSGQRELGQQLEIRADKITNTLTSVQKDNCIIQPIVKPVQKIIGYTRDSQGKVTDRHLKDEAGTIHASSGQGGNTDQFVQDYRIRRLTPIECERLQGFPDNHTQYGDYDGEVKEMSNSQRYKQCGNAVTTDVVQAVAEKIKPLFK